MNKFYHITNLSKGIILILFAFGFSATVFAQSGSKLSEAQKFIEKNLTKYNLEKQDVSELRISSEIQDDNTGITHLYLQQQINGIDVVGSSMGVHFKDGEVRHFTTRFENETAKRKTADAPGISAEAALAILKKDLNLPLNSSNPILKHAEGKNQSMAFSKGNIAADDILAKLVYQKNSENKLALTWQVELYEANQKHYWMIWIDAETGKIIEKRDLVISCDFGGVPIATDAPASVHRHHNHASHSGIAHNNMPAIPEVTNSFENMFMVSNSYRVFAEPIEAPNEPGATHSLIAVDPEFSGSPYGWHSTDNANFNANTIGNNVQARNDLGPFNPVGTPASHPALATSGVAPPFTFDYAADLTMGPETYTDAAIVNLFYWNNIVHDVFYQFGFDEKNGNFQTTNIFNGTDNGGLGGDAVIAEAQDGEGVNNANMLTLPDGAAPRMQMYLWSSSTIDDLVYLNTVNGIPSTTIYEGIEAAFGTNNALDAIGVTGNLVEIDANLAAQVGTDDEGCGTGAGVGLIADNAAALLGNIALIKRGSCSFIEKIESAQLSGATAVIIYNNQPGAGPIAMGGENGNAIIIPALMVSNDDGLALKAAMAMGTVNLTLKRITPNLLLDGDFDNGIIAHEYGHGISNRLTGGPAASGPLGGDEQGGEGWSDYFALYLTTQSGDLGAPTAAHPNGVLPNRGIGTYVIKEDITGGGIRPARYSTDLAVNDYTYGDAHLGNEITIPHGIGFIWCTMLNEMTQNIIDIVPMNDDLYNNGKDAGAGGNNIALRLVMEGLKLQPEDPTFVEMRDGILKADTLVFDSQYSCAIWEAFAKRGVGLQATSGSNALGDEFENFDLPLECGGGMNAILELEKSSAGVLLNNEEIVFTLTLTNNSEIYSATNVVITDNLSSNMTFVSASDGGTHSGGVVTYPTIASIAPGGSVTRTVTVSISTPGSLTTLTFNDDVESAANFWTPSPGLGAWTKVSDRTFSGTNSWFGENQDQVSNQTLTLANQFNVAPGLQLSFFHEYATESEFDGGVVEISTDGGVTWEDLGPHMTQNPYNGSVDIANNPFLGGPVFDGANGKFEETVVDLNSYAGLNALIRFRIACDVQAFVDGWWVDDIRMFVNPIYEINNAIAVAAGGASASASAQVLMLEATEPLPVELVRFEATPKEDVIELTWSTATEVDAKGFVIERLIGNSNEFAEIGYVEARGGTELTNYNLTDNNVAKNVDYYYRLKMVDTDESFEYSDIRSARLNGTNKDDWKISPNPAHDNINISWSNNEMKSAQIDILNIQGQIVGTYSISDTTENNYNIDISHLSSNVYFIQIRSNESLETQKLIIQ